MALAGAEWIEMLDEPVPATAKCFSQPALGIGDIDMFEINEPVASVQVAWLRDTPPRRSVSTSTRCHRAGSAPRMYRGSPS